MKTIIVLGVLSLLVSPLQAELPSMCFDGTYAGGGECEIIIDGQKVGVGLEADEFFENEEQVTKELSELFDVWRDKMIQQ